MSRTLYDSITAADIPSSAQMVGGYVGRSIYRWSDADWALFPNAIKVGIAVDVRDNVGTVGDVETGDMLPWEAPDWCEMRRAAGADPTIYLPEYLKPATITEFDLRGIARPHWWIAAWNDQPVLIPDSVAHQYTHPPNSGGHYDISVVADNWPGVDVSLPPQEEEMLYILSTGSAQYLWNGATMLCTIATPADSAAFNAAGAKVVQVTDAQISSIRQAIAAQAPVHLTGSGSLTGSFTVS